jgi:hypothetical protein
MYACRQLGIPLKDYLRQAFLGPIVCAIPFALCLGTSRLMFSHDPIMAVGVGGATGMLVLGFVYLRYMIPGQYLENLVRPLAGKLRSRQLVARLTGAR